MSSVRSTPTVPSRPTCRRAYPGVKFLVTPTSAAILEQQLGGRPSRRSPTPSAPGTPGRRRAPGRRSPREPGSPFESDLAGVEPALSLALNTPPTSLAASAAMGDVPDPNAQRGLADIVLDPSRPAPIRLSAAGQLARSLQRFGPLVTADQETGLLAGLDEATDPALRTALAAVVGALRPKPAATGQRLRTDPARPPPAPGPRRPPLRRTRKPTRPPPPSPPRPARRRNRNSRRVRVIRATPFDVTPADRIGAVTHPTDPRTVRFDWMTGYGARRRDRAGRSPALGKDARRWPFLTTAAPAAPADDIQPCPA